MIDRPTSHFDRVKELLNAVMERRPADRARFLDDACKGDGALRAEIESLIAAEDTIDSFMEPPMRGAIGGMLTLADGIQATGRRLGAYEITEMIATGGMGTVYRARRRGDDFEREVAIKVIRRGLDAPELVRRFQLERQTLALLDHPNITRLLDGGATEEGLPYIVMEYVVGRPIHEHCDAGRLGLRERLELFVKVCNAVHYAHQRLVVHRDLKPSNILVRDDGEPKLLDFGISKLIDDSAETSAYPATMTTLRVMTPEYSSPEQVRGGRVTTASDIYSLGVVLYELLTGRLPYNLTTPMQSELETAICSAEPERPSTVVLRESEFITRTGTARVIRPSEVAAARGEDPEQLRKHLRGDLDNIVLMALRKDADRRYASVQQFAEDTLRYLDGRTVIARKDTVMYRTGKFVRRNAVPVTMATMLLLALIGATVGTTTGLIRARRAEQQATAERDSAESVVEYLQEALLAASPYRRGQNASVLQILEDAEADINDRLRDRPEAEAGIRFTIGKTYASLWQWRQAIPHLERAAELYRQRRGENDPCIADCLSVLGRARAALGDPQSIKDQWEAWEIRAALYGNEDARVAESLGNLAYAEWRSRGVRDWDLADRHYQRSIEILKNVAPERKKVIARMTFSYAQFCTENERYSDAEELFEEAIALYRELSSNEPVDRYAVECMTRYANILMLSGKADHAEAVLREATYLTPAGFGGIGTNCPHWRLAILCEQMDRLPEAHELFCSSLASQCLRLATRIATSNEAHAAKLDDCSQRLREAATDMSQPVPFRTVFALLRRYKDETDWSLCQRLRDVSDLLRKTGRSEQAVSLMRYSTAVLRQNFAFWTPTVALYRNALGDALIDINAYKEAESLLTVTFPTIQEQYGRVHRETRTAAARLVRLYEAMGDDAAAAPYRPFVLPDPDTRFPKWLGPQSSPFPWDISFAKKLYAKEAGEKSAP